MSDFRIANKIPDISKKKRLIGHVVRKDNAIYASVQKRLYQQMIDLKREDTKLLVLTEERLNRYEELWLVYADKKNTYTHIHTYRERERKRERDTHTHTYIYIYIYSIIYHISSINRMSLLSNKFI